MNDKKSLLVYIDESLRKQIKIKSAIEGKTMHTLVEEALKKAFQE